MNKKEIATRFKIFLVKEDCYDKKIIKPYSNRRNSSNFSIKEIQNIKLYYKQSHEIIPRWYKNFFKQKDKELFLSSIVLRV